MSYIIPGINAIAPHTLLPYWQTGENCGNVGVKVGRSESRRGRDPTSRRSEKSDECPRSTAGSLICSTRDTRQGCVPSTNPAKVVLAIPLEEQVEVNMCPQPLEAAPANTARCSSRNAPLYWAQEAASLRVGTAVVAPGISVVSTPARPSTDEVGITRSEAGRTPFTVGTASA